MFGEEKVGDGDLVVWVVNAWIAMKTAGVPWVNEMKQLEASARCLGSQLWKIRK